MVRFRLKISYMGDNIDGFIGDLDSFDAFVHSFKCSIYSFRGEEISLSGRIPYSIVWCETKSKSLFSRKTEYHENIIEQKPNTIFNEQLPNGVSLSTELETITPTERYTERMMNVRIHVSKSYSSMIYGVRKKYESHKEDMYRIMDGLLNSGRNYSFTKGGFTIYVNSYSIKMTCPGYVNTLNSFKFSSIGMQNLDVDFLEQLAFADVFLECIKERYNDSLDYPSEIIYVGGYPLSIIVDNNPALKPW